MRALAIGLVLVLSGCVGNVQPEQKLVTACNAYANTLVVLAGYKQAGKLSAAQIASVDQIRAVVNPICSGTTAPADVNSAINTVEQYALQLNGLKTGVK